MLLLCFLSFGVLFGVSVVWFSCLCFFRCVRDTCCFRYFALVEDIFHVGFLIFATMPPPPHPAGALPTFHRPSLPLRGHRHCMCWCDDCSLCGCDECTFCCCYCTLCSCPCASVMIVPCACVMVVSCVGVAFVHSAYFMVIPCAVAFVPCAGVMVVPFAGYSNCTLCWCSNGNLCWCDAFVCCRRVPALPGVCRRQHWRLR